MTDEPGFLAALYERPDDDLARQVYADWLDERDDPRGAYLRLEVDLARLDEWSDDLRAKEAELDRLGPSIDPDWLELVGKRYDVWLVDRPTNPLPLMSALHSAGRSLSAIFAVLNHQPSLVTENALRAQATRMRDDLLAACQAGEPGPFSDMPVRLRPAQTPRPRLVRFPAPTDPPGYALRLVTKPARGRGKLLVAIQQALGASEASAGLLVEGEAPCTLRTFATPEEARKAARRFRGVVPVEVRHVDPYAGRILDRPLVARFSVVLHRYPPEVKRQLVAVLRLMTGSTLPQARRLAGSPLPLVLRSGIDWETAEALRQALPARAHVEVCEDAG